MSVTEGISSTDKNSIDITTTEKEIGYTGLLVVSVTLIGRWSSFHILINKIPVFYFGNGSSSNKNGTIVSISQCFRVKSTDTIYIHPDSSDYSIDGAIVYAEK